jgi:DNA helicase-2/ATP-dependent DNA helicase PcrA
MIQLRPGSSHTKYDDRPISTFIEPGNFAQEEAISASSDSPLLILAGPGSGKTTTLIKRCWGIYQKLISRGVIQDHFLVMTFSKNAAVETLSRLRRLADPSDSFYSSVEVSTFHSFSYKLINVYRNLLRFKIPPQLCSFQDACRLIKVSILKGWRFF